MVYSQYGAPIPLWAGAPFFILLLGIAVLPLLCRRWWGRFYPLVSIGLGALTAVYYLVIRGAPMPVIHSVMEFVSFIALVGSLYVIAGGIHIRLRGLSRPLSNVVFLALGAVIANIIGTTGASMILIRPFIRVNRYRIRPFHIFFFIAVVSNIGGGLTPIGDPPLFLGYLLGVPFFWVLRTTWHIWLLTMALILGAFYVMDRRGFVHLSPDRQRRAESVGEEGEVHGLHNLFFLAIVLGAVFVTDPPFVREVLMAAAAAGSWFATRKEIHAKNEFDFVPIKEVTILFAGIFATMVPVLDWIEQNSAGLGLNTAGPYFWATGVLSSVLDSAPTYMNFLGAAVGNTSTASLAASHPEILQAISLGAVFFGAMTYIGNIPNLMVKSIAERSGVTCPSFGTYIARYALPILLPVFALVWLIFFRN